MTTLELDLSRPLIVVLGTWNPAIFQVPWLGLNVFGKAKGETVSVTQVLLSEGVPALYFGDVGIGVGPRRIDFYGNNLKTETKSAVEKTCIKIIDLLPHTPMGSIGINYVFSVVGQDQQITDKLRTAEKIDEKFSVAEQTFTAAIELEKGIRLNLRRDVSDARIGLNLNFHHDTKTADEIKKVAEGCIDRLYARSIEIIEKLYGHYDITVKGHAFPVDAEAGTNP